MGGRAYALRKGYHCYAPQNDSYTPCVVKRGRGLDNDIICCIGCLHQSEPRIIGGKNCDDTKYGRAVLYDESNDLVQHTEEYGRRSVDVPHDRVQLLAEFHGKLRNPFTGLVDCRLCRIVENGVFVRGRGALAESLISLAQLPFKEVEV